jgi:hypothetical protein
MPQIASLDNKLCCCFEPFLHLVLKHAFLALPFFRVPGGLPDGCTSRVQTIKKKKQKQKEPSIVRKEILQQSPFYVMSLLSSVTGNTLVKLTI